MVLSTIPHLETHAAASDVTTQVTPEEIERIRPTSTEACSCSGTVPVGYTVIEFNNTDPSNPVSALVTEVAAVPTAGKLTHWRFVFLTTSPFGVGMALSYGDGWKQRAEYLNSSNGGLCGRGLQAGQWVPSFAKAGAQVDFMIEVENNHVKAYIAMDRQPRGLAFDLDFAANPDAIRQLKPVIMCHGAGARSRIAVIQFAPGVPSDAYKQRAVVIDPQCPAGDYVIGREQFGENVPEDRARVHVGPGGEVSFRVVNNLTNGARLQPGGVIGGAAPHAAMTRMMPPPEFEAAERAVAAWIGGLRTWSFANNQLTLNDKTFPLYTGVQTVTQNDLI